MSKCVDSCRSVLRYFSFLFALLLLLGCERGHVADATICETDDKNFVTAAQYIKSGQYDDAVVCLLEVVKSRDSAPESSLLLGTIYVDKKSDPISAIFFLRKYIEECGSETQAKIAEQLINTAKKEFLKSFHAYNGISQEDSEMIDILRNLKDKNIALIGQVSAYERKIADYEETIKKLKDEYSAAIKSARSNHAQIVNISNNQERIHVVESGETLSSISAKYYGAQNFWHKIFEANKAIISNSKNLKIGQKLIIP